MFYFWKEIWVLHICNVLYSVNYLTSPLLPSSSALLLFHQGGGQLPALATTSTSPTTSTSWPSSTSACPSLLFSRQWSLCDTKVHWFQYCLIFIIDIVLRDAGADVRGWRPIIPLDRVIYICSFQLIVARFLLKCTSSARNPLVLKYHTDHGGGSDTIICEDKTCGDIDDPNVEVSNLPSAFSSPHPALSSSAPLSSTSPPPPAVFSSPPRSSPPPVSSRSSPTRSSWTNDRRFYGSFAFIFLRKKRKFRFASFLKIGLSIFVCICWRLVWKYFHFRELAFIKNDRRAIDEASFPRNLINYSNSSKCIHYLLNRNVINYKLISFTSD